MYKYLGGDKKLKTVRFVSPLYVDYRKETTSTEQKSFIKPFDFDILKKDNTFAIHFEKENIFAHDLIRKNYFPRK